jgi:Tfp pilus assembly protein FimV
MDILQSHLEAYKVVCTELEPLQTQLKELQEQVKQRLAKQAELEKSIDAEMQNIGEQKVFMWNFAVSYRKSSALKVFDETLIPAQFFVNVPKRLDTEIKKAIQNGELIAGAEIEERQNLQIKF